jgi:hypothetical protein
MASQGSSAGSADFGKIGRQSMEAELSIGAGDSTAMDVVDAIGGVLNTKGAAMNADIKKRYNEKQKSVDEFGKKLELAFIDMGPEMENLGQESYQKANDDVFGLREAWADCEGLGEPAAIKKCQADLMVKLNTIKTRHSTDAENAKNLAGLWQGELDEDGNRGEPSADVKAMSDDDKGIMEQFISNKSKRVVYLNEDGSGPGDILNYAWEVPVLDTDENSPTFGEQLIGPDGQPVVETKAYSNDYLQEIIPIKETVNGEKLEDLIQEEKEKKGKGLKVSDNAALKKAVGDMIPKTKHALRSWAYSNPAAQDYLNVHDYLVDHPILNGQYEKLGVEDTNGDGVINHEDFIALEDKESIIKKIMDAEDVNLSHEILTDIYASCAGNEISGIGNKEYYPERHVLSNKANEQVVAEHDQKENQEKLTKLQSLADPEVLKNMGGANENEIAEMLDLDPNEKIYNPTTGEYESIKTYIANATNKKARSKKTADDYLNE